ncbi:MAG: ABC transporter ATP-binding protein [Proteobacteria bacterium]|nr:ABC transporter ATP-binding protein [Pseudomonadota bacterium]
MKRFVDSTKSISAFLLYIIFEKKINFIFLAIFAIMADLASNILLPYTTGKLIDSLSAINSNAQAVLPTALILLGAWVLTEFAEGAKGIMLAITMPHVEASIRTKSFAQINKYPYAYFTKKNLGDIGQRINTLPTSAKNIIDDSFTVFLPLIVSIIISAIFLYFVNSILALIFSCWLITHIAICLWYCIKATERSSHQSASRAKLYGRITDAILNQLSIKIFNNYKHEEKEVLTMQQDEVQKYKRNLLYVERFKILLSCISIMFIAVLLYISLQLWHAGGITSGSLIYIITNILSIVQDLWVAGDEISFSFYELGICKQSLKVLHAESEGIGDKDKQRLQITNGNIQFKNVRFGYTKDKSLFHNKDIEIKAGQKVGLIGFSGSGKTTFANLIMRFYDVEYGSIIIDAQDIKNYSLESVREGIAFIPQDTILFHRSIMENIRYGKLNATDEEVIEAAKKAECHDFIMRLENQYEAAVGERGSLLSGGQRQRISIARTILKDAKIIIMDEATSALDAITESLINKSIKNLTHGKTTITIAHKLSTVMEMDRILVFDNGRIIEDGSHKDLIALKGYYEHIWKMHNSQENVKL